MKGEWTIAKRQIERSKRRSGARDIQSAMDRSIYEGLWDDYCAAGYWLTIQFLTEGKHPWIADMLERDKSAWMCRIINGEFRDKFRKRGGHAKIIDLGKVVMGSENVLSIDGSEYGIREREAAFYKRVALAWLEHRGVGCAKHGEGLKR